MPTQARSALSEPAPPHNSTPNTKPTEYSSPHPCTKTSICSGDTTHEGGTMRSPRTVGAKGHPLDPLTSEEIEAARDAVIRHFSSSALCDGKSPRFSFITLREPPPHVTDSGLARHIGDLRITGTEETSSNSPYRQADVVVHLPPTKPHWLIVNLVSTPPSVTSVKQLPHGTQPVFTPNDCELAAQIAQNDPGLKALLKEYFGQDDTSRIVCDTGSVHLAEGRPMPNCRFMNVSLFMRDTTKGNPEEHNYYANPMPITPMVDLVSRTVVKIHGEEKLRGTTPQKDVTKAYPSARVDYFENAMQYNAHGPTKLNYEDPLRPMRITQPSGPSFSLQGRDLSWQKWRVHIGFNYREGLVLNDVSFGGRSIIRRASLVEMAVPYAERAHPYPQKCAFDVGDYGLGYCANSLKNGCDCLGEIKYLDATMADTNGNPYTVENAICIHEEDVGILHKHVEYRSGKAFVRRARKLVISFIATVVNYEYLFYWWLHVDGSMGLEIRLTGELSTNVVKHSDVLAHRGTLVAPNVNAQLHQHMFCARIDPSLDGPINRVSEVNAVPASHEDGGKYGCAFSVEQTLLRNEKEAQRDSIAGRLWRISNNDVINKVSGKPVGYKLVPTALAGPQPSLLTRGDSGMSKRARFAERGLWVTPWTQDQRFPAGEFPTQGVGETDTGLPEWVTENRDVVDKQLVLWHAFGVTHMPRPEDFPIMPCEMVGFTLKPDSFFETNPALDICYTPDTGATCHS